MQAAPKVFISHASEDKQRLVEQFAQCLRATGVDAWLDKWEMNPATAWWAKSLRAMRLRTRAVGQSENMDPIPALFTGHVGSSLPPALPPVLIVARA
jgi:hypothetical protein